MNVIFLTISRISNINERGIYTDLIRKFRDEGHCVYIVTPLERQFNKPTKLEYRDGVTILGVKTLNLQKTNFIEKGVGTILMEYQFKNAIKRYLHQTKFDLILYSTPPITFSKIICWLKRFSPSAKSYLLLKDIFPQNAIDLGLFTKKNPIYHYFRNKEKKLYKISDFIGCMSPANVEYVINNNPYISRQKVEVAPNSIELTDCKDNINKNEVRLKHNLPLNIPIFIYGGNIGKPQGVDFIIRCLESNREREDCHFVIVGNGTEYYKIKNWYNAAKPKNVTLFGFLKKVDYDLLVKACDVGLIFLDYRFTIPNFPSRLLSYLENKMPVVVAADENTDIGDIAQKNGFGYNCPSNNEGNFNNIIQKILGNRDSISVMGKNGYQFLKENYLTQHTYFKIKSHL